MSSFIACYDMLTPVSPGKYKAGDALHIAGTHIWLVKLTDHLPLLSSATTILTTDEQERAGKYRKEADRNRFVLGRIVLRTLLAEKLYCQPKEVPIIISKHRKPIIAGDVETLQFSISHSGDYVLVGINQKEVGVDIEHIDTAFDYKNVMQYSFNTEEVAFVNGGEWASLNFYLLWTRKEALLKATGKGLTSKLPQIAALTGEQEISQDVIDSRNNYKISSVVINDTYIASVCRSTDSDEIVFWEW